jgi:hypothetical protein
VYSPDSIEKKKLKHIHFLFSDFCSFLFQFLQVPSFSRITLFIFYYYYTLGQFSCNLVRHFNLFLLFVAALYVCSIGNIYVFSQIEVYLSLSRVTGIISLSGQPSRQGTTIYQQFPLAARLSHSAPLAALIQVTKYIYAKSLTS